MMNEPINKMIEVEGKVAAYDNGKIRIYTELLDGTLGFNLGDKVKIIIVKEDGQ